MWVVSRLSEYLSRRRLRRAKGMEGRISYLLRERLLLDEELRSYKERFGQLRIRMDKELLRADSAADRAMELNKKLEVALEGIREELRIAKEITILSLVAANETFKNTWDAQSAIEARKLALAQTNLSERAV